MPVRLREYGAAILRLVAPGICRQPHLHTHAMRHTTQLPRSETLGYQSRQLLSTWLPGGTPLCKQTVPRGAARSRDLHLKPR